VGSVALSGPERKRVSEVGVTVRLFTQAGIRCLSSAGTRAVTDPRRGMARACADDAESSVRAGGDLHCSRPGAVVARRRAESETPAGARSQQQRGERIRPAFQK